MNLATEHDKQKLTLNLSFVFYCCDINVLTARHMSLLEPNMAAFTLIFLTVYTLTLNLNVRLRVSLWGHSGHQKGGSIIEPKGDQKTLLPMM